MPSDETVHHTHAHAPNPSLALRAPRSRAASAIARHGAGAALYVHLTRITSLPDWKMQIMRYLSKYAAKGRGRPGVPPPDAAVQLVRRHAHRCSGGRLHLPSV